MRFPLRLLAAVLAFCLFGAAPAHAWWNGDWAQRAKITLNAGDGGAGLQGPAAQVPLLVRLHSGNFDFAKAKPDGSDLKFIAGDDKTPLRHHLEKWDPESDIGLAWVSLPALAPGTEAAIWLYYGNAKAVKSEDAKGSYDAAQLAVFHFAENDGAPRDATGFGHHAASSAGQRSAASLIGPGLVLAGGEPLRIAAAPGLKLQPASGFTFTAWVKLGAAQNATLYAQREPGKALLVSLAGGALTAAIENGKASVKAAGGALTPGTWHHVAVTAGKRLALFVDGVEVASAAGELPELAGDILIGQGFTGELDEVTLAATARGADYLRAAAKGQGPDALLVVFGEGEESSGGTSYMGILLAAVTIDGWVVIGILAVMLLIGAWVTVSKTLLVNRNERANGEFLRAYRQHTADAGLLLSIGDTSLADSSLFRVYRAGADEMRSRSGASVGAAAALVLSDKAIESVRATLDAAQVRENQRLNRSMVLLTIAISGGPFLGLLGTVIGVMITFAAIAATGDVNVAAIAPGIAGALMATAAGVGVAIPALFAYNYIGSRIKNVSADMRVFSDEFLARLAETYGG